MKSVEIYTKSHCPYCWRAKELLRIKGVRFQEYDIANDRPRANEMVKRSGRETVPEIFIDSKLIGGCDELFELDEQDLLNRLLEIRQPAGG